ncbi:MAG: hypothetical protein ABI760_18110 [Ferruginibacter sp.]
MFNIAEISNLKKEEYMENFRIQMARWDEYAILKTAREEGFNMGMEEGLKATDKGIEIGMEKKSYEVVKNLLAANNFTITEIANLANVTEAFVKKVRRDLKK